MNKLVLIYILKLLELQEVRIKCINLGFNLSEDLLAELEIIEEAKKYIKTIKKSNI